MRRISLSSCFFVLAFLMSAPGIHAQTDTPPVDPADVASAEAIVEALYDVISGPAGQARDWDRMRSLFVPGARLIPAGARPDGSVGLTMLSVEDYIERAGPQLEENGFFEHEIARQTDEYAHIQHVFSTYEARREAEDEEPFMRGINSIQLMNDGERWWIVTVFWEAETAETPLPERYLPGYEGYAHPDHH